MSQKRVRQQFVSPAAPIAGSERGTCSECSNVFSSWQILLEDPFSESNYLAEFSAHFRWARNVVTGGADFWRWAVPLSTALSSGDRGGAVDESHRRSKSCRERRTMKTSTASKTSKDPSNAQPLHDVSVPDSLLPDQY